jgi:hypothetical protein
MNGYRILLVIMSVVATLTFLFGVYILLTATEEMNNDPNYLWREDRAIYMTGFAVFWAAIGWRAVYMERIKKK